MRTRKSCLSASAMCSKQFADGGWLRHGVCAVVLIGGVVYYRRAKHKSARISESSGTRKVEQKSQVIPMTLQSGSAAAEKYHQLLLISGIHSTLSSSKHFAHHHPATAS